MRCRTSHAGGCGRGNVHPAAVLAARRGGGVPPRAAVLDGITSHITHDGLAADAYAQTKVATGYVMLVKATDDTINQLWTTVGTVSASSTYHDGPAAGIAAGGPALAVVVNAGSVKANATGTAATNQVDGGWRVIHHADHLNGASGDITAQVDGGTREIIASYTRFAQPSPDYTLCTVGALRYKAGPTITILAEGTVGYLARYDGEILDQAAWDAIYAAFDTGGGRRNTRRLSDAIAAQLTTGTLKWAGPLDGSDPHYNPDSVAAPIHVDTVIVDAEY